MGGAGNASCSGSWRPRDVNGLVFAGVGIEGEVGTPTSLLRQRCGFDAALVVGSVACSQHFQRCCALLVPWWHFKTCQVIFPAEALWRLRGVSH
jgi:hypothetical protein